MPGEMSERGTPNPFGPPACNVHYGIFSAGHLLEARVQTRFRKSLAVSRRPYFASVRVFPRCRYAACPNRVRQPSEALPAPSRACRSARPVHLVSIGFQRPVGGVTLREVEARLRRCPGAWREKGRLLPPSVRVLPHTAGSWGRLGRTRTVLFRGHLRTRWCLPTGGGPGCAGRG